MCFQYYIYETSCSCLLCLKRIMFLYIIKNDKFINNCSDIIKNACNLLSSFDFWINKTSVAARVTLLPPCIHANR